MRHVIKFRVTKVDEYGWNGRDNHPSKSDEGLLVTAVHMEMCHYDEEGQETRLLEKIGDTVENPALAKDEDNLVAFWTCVTEDGRTLDFVNYELEEVQDA